jgi:hypothetical protein
MQRCAAWLSWGVSHPYGQLFFLVFLSLPLGISALIVSDASFKAIETAVGSFNRILDNWGRATITDIQVLERSANCPAGQATPEPAAPWDSCRL